MDERFVRSGPGRAVARVATSVAVVAATAFAGIAPAGATSAFTVTRYQGADRYATAAAIATAAFPSGTNNAVIATGENFPDALAASYYAGALGAALLLTQHDTVPQATRDALNTLKIKNVTLMGGNQAINQDVQSQIASTASSSSSGGSITVTRVSGDDRYGTAAAAGVNGTPGTIGGKKTAIVASGADANFPDALAGGPAAFAAHFPVLLTDPNVEPIATEQALETQGITNVLVLGGTNAVSDSVVTQLQTTGRTVTRIGGVDRSDTAAKIWDFERQNLSFLNTTVALANGQRFADSLAGAQLAGTKQAGVLLTADTDNLGSATTSDVQSNANTLTTGLIFGGPQAVSTFAEAAFNQAAGATTTGGGAITLAATTVSPGGSITGTVSNPSNISTVSVSGCGLSSQSVTFSSSTGAFTVTIPAGQPAGSCTLVFVVTPKTGSSSSQSFPITVVAAPVTTNAPDLATASLVAGQADTVVYTFDAAVTTTAPVASKFRVYDSSGVEHHGQTATVAGTGVTVVFPTGTTTGATVGAVDQGTVANATGPNPVASVPLAGTVGTTTLPMLTRVQVLAGDGVFTGGSVVFTFNGSLIAHGYAVVSPSDFVLYNANGQPLAASAPGTISTDGTQVTFTVASLLGAGAFPSTSGRVAGGAFDTLGETGGSPRFVEGSRPLS